MNKRILRVDASSLKLLGCPQRFNLAIVRGLRKSLLDSRMEFGSAVHVFLKYKYDDAGDGFALEKALEYWDTRVSQGMVVNECDFRDRGHLYLTCVQYSLAYVKDKFKIAKIDGKAATEMSFAIPVAADDQTEIILCGTIDAIGTLYGQRVFMDHKSTSTRGTYIPTFFRSYELNTQMLTYNYALSRVSEMYPDTFDWASNLPCIINGIFLAKGNNKYERSGIIEFSSTVREAFERQLENTFKELLDSVRDNSWPLKGLVNDGCQSKFGMCEFSDICGRPEGVLEEDVVSLHYKTVPYDPMKHGKL